MKITKNPMAIPLCIATAILYFLLCPGLNEVLGFWPTALIGILALVLVVRLFVLEEE